ncbi:hypothetical protein G9C98_006103 [Cotesia typhae]|uniref:Uncharacterized protein n=1 Tax=Cotesia typhae TaxID=2053667 RepID=A0A8J5URJ4_9HYME|nr:hypothetical protein G9C98_006103 [Cotesia typhae]
MTVHQEIIKQDNVKTRYSLIKRENNNEDSMVLNSCNFFNNYLVGTPNNITKHFAMGNNNGENESNVIDRNSSQSQVIQNYLNQTIPFRTTTMTKIEINNRIKGDRKVNNIINNNRCKNDTTVNHHIISGYKLTRSQIIKNNHLKHGIVIQKINQSNIKNLRYNNVNNYNQNHGVITASAYSDLCNRTAVDG